MVELSDCYFCGTVGDELETYAAIPPETTPPADRQRTVEVCPTCREKLDRVVDPVIAHLSGDAQESPREPDRTSGGSDAADDEADDVSGDAESDGERVATDPDPEREAETVATDDPDEAVDLPDETRQILRMLGNREFPVDRGEIVAVTTNAYGVRRDEAAAVIDALLDRGRLREEDGTLYRHD
jgi:hypothetical protein